MKMTTLCYIEKGGKYLMLHRVKKHHDINAGKWIGVGGHVENGETPEECLLREVKEETGLELTAYRLRGLVTFLSDVCEPELMCVFTADAFDGELIECDEGELAWVEKSKTAVPAVSGDTVDKRQALASDTKLVECNEGTLHWVEKSDVLGLPTWEGDRVFLERLLSGDERFFSIKLRYEGDRLVEKKITDY